MLSEHITISEVGARDGIQTEATFIPTGRKIELIDALTATGLKRVEAASFVHPKVVPQMSDAVEVMRGIRRRPGTRIGAFVPNTKGAEAALAAQVDDLKVGSAASDAFNELNVRMPLEKNLAVLRDIASLAAGSAGRLVGVVGTAFGCPYSGPVDVERVAHIVEAYSELGIELTYLADTTGMASPREIRAALEMLRPRFPAMMFGLHLHNTRGLGIANALAGLDLGVRDFESSIGGLGGCPFAPRAVGNISTEDFAHMAVQMGYSVDADIDGLIACAMLAEEIVGHPTSGMVMKAGKSTDLHAVPRENAAAPS
jgi:hydroxymethylglutaryl-CoA lyase